MVTAAQSNPRPLPRLDVLIAEFRRIARGLVHGLVTHQITLAQFDIEMRREIRVHHLAAAVIANNGVVPDDLSAVQAVVDAQMRYFDRWYSGLLLGSLPSDGLAALLEQLAQQETPQQQNNPTPLLAGVLALLAGRKLLGANGLQQVAQQNTLTDANLNRLSARAGAYASAITQTASRVGLQAQGLPLLPFYHADRSLCRNACYCDWRILARGDGDYDCFWTLDYYGVPLEHCPTCLARARAANPLRVRRGAIMDAEKYQEASLYA